MSVERNLDFQVAAWLDASATTTVPETLLDRSLSRVAVTRQRPRWFVGRLGPAGLRSTRRIRIVALVAATVVLIALWISAFGIGQRPVLHPSPSPTASPPGPTGPLLPTSLRANWVAPTRTPLPGEPSVIQSAFNLSTAELQIYPGVGEPILSSVATWLGSNQVSFRLRADGGGCHVGDVGTYTFILNQSNRALTLDPVNELCAARRVLVSGDWTRADCPNHNSLCLGDLDSGEHASNAFNPFTPRDKLAYEYGRLSYTVPEGWSNPVDGPDGFVLVEQANRDGGSIEINSTAIADSQAADCPGTTEPGVGRTPAALAAWVASLPGIDATTPAQVTVGGVSGKTLDITIKPSWTHTCGYSQGKPVVPLFTNGLSGDINFDWGLSPPRKARLFLLAVPDGRTTLIHVEAPDSTTWDAFVAAATPVLETFQFHP